MPVTAIKTIVVTAAQGTTVSDWIPLDIHVTPFNVGFGVVIDNSGAAVFRVEHTFDNILDPDVTPDVFVHEDVSANNGNVDGNFAFGIRAMRLAVQTVSAATTVALKVVQVGNVS